MGFTKNKAWSVVIALIFAVAFNVIMFMLPLKHGIMFWMGYAFEMFSAVFLLLSALVLLNKFDISGRFHALSALYVGWIYFVIQTVLSVKQMTSVQTSYMCGITADVILSAIACISLILTSAAQRKTVQTEKETYGKTSYIRNLRADIELLNAKDSDAANAINKLAEAVRFSDPMSHSMLFGVEHKISEKFNMLKDNTDNSSMVIAICGDMQQLLKERNERCKTLKKVPEPQRETDNSGAGIVSAAFGIVSIAVLIVLATCFIFIPNGKYNEAAALYAQQQYEEAAAAFSELGSYKDSAYRLAEINKKITDENYEIAESYYKDQNYVEALKLYSQLGDYKNSKDRIEQIHNKFANGGEIYFGTYNGNAVLWTILKTEQDRMLLITKDSVENIAFNDEAKNITYENSTIKDWLNSDFIKEFSEGQKERVLKNTENSDDGIFILNKEEYDEYSKDLSLNTDADWWLRTKTPAGMMFVNEAGEVNETGESVVRAMGVRPCVWISLK